MSPQERQAYYVQDNSPLTQKSAYISIKILGLALTIVQTICKVHIEYHFAAIVLSQRFCLQLVSSATTAAHWIVLRTNL